MLHLQHYFKLEKCVVGKFLVYLNKVMNLKNTLIVEVQELKNSLVPYFSVIILRMVN